MTGETPLEITHVRDRLLQDFRGRIPEAVTGDADERERNLLTRALAAFAVHKLTGCSLDDAAAAVVDGGGDGGIDALHYASASSTLWVAQSKFFADGQGEPSLGDVSKFRDGMEALLRGDFDVFDKNPLIKQRKPLIRRYFDDASLQVRAVLVYSGVQLVSEDRIRLFERLRDQFSADTDYFTFQRFNLTSVHGWLVGPVNRWGFRKSGWSCCVPRASRNPTRHITAWSASLPSPNCTSCTRNSSWRRTCVNTKVQRTSTTAF